MANRFPLSTTYRFDLASFDLLSVKTLEGVENAAHSVMSQGGDGDDGGGAEANSGEILVPEGWEDLSFTTHLSDGTVINLCHPVPPSGGGGEMMENEVRVTRSNWKEYISAAESARLKESSAMLRAFQDGVSAVLPLEIFPLFTDEEFEKLMCGVREVDVDLLRQCTE